MWNPSESKNQRIRVLEPSEPHREPAIPGVWKKESQGQVSPGSGHFKRRNGDKRTAGSRYWKKIRVKEPSVFILPNPSKNPTGVSLKRTGIAFFCAVI
jgi:hypothetical protein